jgi:hypothetical protein
MNDHEVLEKIKKLLRLGKSPNPHEAELAVQRAFELAARHQIDIESVNLEDDVRRIVAEKFPCQSRLSFARKKILNLLVSFFNVNIVVQPVPDWARKINLKQPAITFIGKTVDIQIARYVYDFLHTVCATSLKQYAKALHRKPSRSTQENYIQGFIYGVSKALQESVATLSHQQSGLIVNEKARRKHFEETIFDPESLAVVKARDVSRKNMEAMTAGFLDGQKVNIRKPIETNGAGQLLLQ